MKGIMEHINELKAETFTFSVPKTDEEYRIFFNDLEKVFAEYDKDYKQRAIEKSNRQQQNLKYLKRKAKELGKEIPSEVLVYMVYMDQPVGAWFFERYSEWLTDEPKKPEVPTNAELVLQHAMKNFPVRK